MGMPIKNSISNMLESLAGDILTSTSCPLIWGEVRLPDCLRAEIQDSEADTESK